MDDFQRITIIGLGLMGGSLAMALRERNICRITGFDLSVDAMAEARQRRLIDGWTHSLQEAVTDAQLVVLATPVGSYRGLCQQMGSGLKPGVVVTDLGSVKKSAMAAAGMLPAHAFFVGGHPLAGSEKGGLAAATPYLFENAYYFLTPSARTPDAVINQMKTWVSTLGAFPVIVEAAEHDRILAKTSHFPHAAASLLATVVADEADDSMTAFTGSGFRDTTRIASGNPELWEEIFHLNRQELITCLHQLESKTKRMRHALEKEDRRWISDFLQAGKAFRDSLPQAGKDYLPAWYELYVDIKDEPGALAAITGVLAQAGVNIREIEILHVREGEKGAVRLAFTSAEAEQAAMNALSGKGHSFARSKGEKNHADNESNR